MVVGVLGLGLIGGSMVRVYSKAGYCVYAYDTDEMMLSFAEVAGAIDGRLLPVNIAKCDLILLAIYPGGCMEWLDQNAKYIKKTALVIDCCGIKREICKHCFPIAQKYGFTFMGGHPMAGSHYSGFKYSRSNLFQNAPMVLVPHRFDDMQLLDRAREMLAPCRFSSFAVCTAQEHDRMIAFTSQMPHIVSNAYIKSPTARNHKGFSAGSYKDLTRVAWLNPQMWAELFLANRDNLLEELDFYIGSLQSYRDALAAEDEETLIQLLEEGKRRKEEVDG